jgi:dipeptidase E
MLVLGSVTGRVIVKAEKFFPKPFRETRLVIITTASNPYEDKPWFFKEMDQVAQAGFQITEIDIAGKTEQDLRDAFAEIDGVYVMGGNTYYLLHHTRESGFDIFVKEILARGGFYIGSSAGSVLAGVTIDIARTIDDPDVVEMTDFTGMKLVEFCVVPHIGMEGYAEMIEQIFEDWKNEPVNLLGLTDDQAVIIRNNLMEYIGS